MTRDEGESQRCSGRSAPGFVRKTILLSRATNEALRTKAFAERRPESEIVREALDRMLGLVTDCTEL